jgi:hypothetical protein
MNKRLILESYIVATEWIWLERNTWSLYRFLLNNYFLMGARISNLLFAYFWGTGIAKLLEIHDYNDSWIIDVETCSEIHWLNFPDQMSRSQQLSKEIWFEMSLMDSLLAKSGFMWKNMQFKRVMKHPNMIANWMMYTEELITI